MTKKAQTLTDYINEHFGGSQAAFARPQGVLPPQVTQWIDKDFIVVDGVRYSPRGELSGNSRQLK